MVTAQMTEAAEAYTQAVKDISGQFQLDMEDMYQLYRDKMQAAWYHYEEAVAKERAAATSNTRTGGTADEQNSGTSPGHGARDGIPSGPGADISPDRDEGGSEVTKQGAADDGTHPDTW